MPGGDLRRPMIQIGNVESIFQGGAAAFG